MVHSLTGETNLNMEAQLDVAIKADLALILPDLVLATFLEKTKHFFKSDENLPRGKTLDNAAIMRSSSPVGQILTDSTAQDYLGRLVEKADSSPIPIAVRSPVLRKGAC